VGEIAVKEHLCTYINKCREQLKILPSPADAHQSASQGPLPYKRAAQQQSLQGLPTHAQWRPSLVSFLSLADGLSFNDIDK